AHLRLEIGLGIGGGLAAEPDDLAALRRNGPRKCPLLGARIRCVTFLGRGPRRPEQPTNQQPRHDRAELMHIDLQVCVRQQTTSRYVPSSLVFYPPSLIPHPSSFIPHPSSSRAQSCVSMIVFSSFKKAAE